MTRIPMIALTLLLVGCGAQKQHTAIQNQGEELRFDLAALYVDKGVNKAAVPLLQKVLADNPKDARARVLYGKVLRDLGLHLQAERELTYALRLAPENAEAHSALGILYDLTRRSARARKHHVRAIRLDSGVAKYRNNLGFSLYLSGEHEQAVQHLEVALAMDPSMAVAYNNLGFAYGKLGRYDRAETTFRAALTEANALLNMAVIYDERGDTERAAAARAQAYQLDPDLEDKDL